MKSKKLSKKLLINKSTIADLGNREMKSVKGGDSGFPFCTEYTICPVNCTQILSKCDPCSNVGC